MNQIKRTSKTVPFGYVLSPDYPGLLDSVDDQLEKLSEAFGFLNRGGSYRGVARWLSTSSGRYISHTGLMQRYSKEKGNLPTQTSQESKA